MGLISFFVINLLSLYRYQQHNSLNHVSRKGIFSVDHKTKFLWTVKKSLYKIQMKEKRAFFFSNVNNSCLN